MASTLSNPDLSESVNHASLASQEPVSYVSFRDIAQDLFAGIRALHKEHGPIAAIQDGSQRVILLFDPKYNQQVLSDPQTYHARFFAIRGPRNSSQRRLTCGLLAMNGEQHLRNRRIVKQPFSLKSISTYGPAIHELSTEMLETWRPGTVVDLGDEMRRLMLRITSTLLFGFDQPKRAYRLGDMIAHWVTMNHRLGTGALVPNDIFNENYEDLLEFAEQMEVEIVDLIRQRQAADHRGNDVLSILVRTHDEEGRLSNEELVGQTSVLFAAAHMTTAHSLTWTLLLLAQHPEIMRDLWDEINHEQEGDVARPEGKIGGDSGALLDRVIKESMRILPASAYSQRVNMQPVQLGPLSVPRGTGIVFTPLIVHHLAHLYDQPDSFLPDRWLTIRPSTYEYHPFGAGPRMCIGGPLAMGIIRTVLPLILRKFRLRVVPDSDVNVQVESTMLGPVGEIPVEIRAADGVYDSTPMTGNVHELVDFPHEC